MNKQIPALTVTQLNEYVKSLLDASTFLSKVYIKGEISNFKNHYTGHFYFTLKDEKSTLKAVMFSSYASKLNFVPEDSMQVLVSGRISVYPRDGIYQIYAESMEPLGKGALYAAFEQMKARLEAKGYFDSIHKKPIPQFPRKIGIITSPIGAAVADMKNIISRRYPLTEICIYPALVQGEGAVADLCEGLKYFDNDDTCDVIIIGRGGGSIEDLWAFNEEKLATAVFNCNTPVISAVGHETDFTICDFVADLRAPTPSAAAELAVPDSKELANFLISCHSRLYTAMSGFISAKKSQLDVLLSKKCFASPLYMTERINDELAGLDRRISHSIEVILESDKQKMESVASRLSALNPLEILSRGYAAVFNEEKNVVSTVKNIKEDDVLELRFADGKAKAKVIKTHIEC